jgi:predicted extracellular nuclease
MIDYYVAWWNVENLFDRSTSPDRPARLSSALRSELTGWTAAVLQRKIAQLSSIILQMNEGRGPDVLGVCEVENRNVLEMLVAALAPLGRSYGIAHHDGGDGRGIDVAFIYDTTLLTPVDQFHHVVLKRNTTRDILQVDFTTSQGRRLILLANHWPARMGGVLESEPYRIIAAETLSYWLSRIQELRGINANVLVMGDFNDEPFDRSLVKYALSTPSKDKVARARNPVLLNLMYPILGQTLGSYYYDNYPTVLDQLLTTRGMARSTAEMRVDRDTVEVVRFPEMISNGVYPAPIRFGRPSRASSYDPDGYSDHYPIAVRILERD